MNDGVKISGPHIIKLQDKRIKVQLEYHSPPKNDSKTRVIKVALQQHIKKEKEQTKSLKKIHNLNSFRSINRFKSQNASPYFYCKLIQESQHLIGDYEMFHQRMIENETQPLKLKVYSNSKWLITVKQKSYSKVMNSNNNNFKQNSGNPSQQVLLRKIKLYSPIKGSLQSKEHHIKPIQKQIRNHQIRLTRTIKLQGNPNRSYKLEVTSSKSRNKHGSIISKKDKSLDASKQINSKFEQETPQRFLKSFNSMSLNEK